MSFLFHLVSSTLSVGLTFLIFYVLISEGDFLTVGVIGFGLSVAYLGVRYANEIKGLIN